MSDDTPKRGPGRPRLAPFVSHAEDRRRTNEHNSERVKANRAKGNEIGELPAVKDPVRKAACAESAELFATTYLPAVFALPFADMHRQIIRKGETLVRSGGLLAEALPRASGKTAIARMLAMWAILYGYRQYIYYIAANAKLAKRSLDVIKSWIWSPLLIEDFPEAVYPLRCLNREPLACLRQTYQGEKTLTKWSTDAIVFPTIPDSRASGAIFSVDSITSGFRGADYAHPSGRTLRPSFCVIDDPQTDKSSRSDSACEERERLIAGAILGLAPPDQSMAAVMPCTVICDGDLSSRMLDMKEHPEWNPSRFGLVKSFPTDIEKWANYREILVNFNPELPDDNKRAEREATAYYVANREAMNAGAEVTWPARKADAHDALQFAMNLKIRDEERFWYEYQNGLGAPAKAEDVAALKPGQISSKLSNIPQGIVPVNCSRLAMGIDVQKRILYYVVCAWADDFTGYVVDYGTYPKQRLPYFKASDVENDLAKATKQHGIEAQLSEGLKRLTSLLLGREWLVDGAGRVARIERCVIDSGDFTEDIFRFCRQSDFASILTPSKGFGLGAGKAPMSTWTLKTGERRGLNWILKTAESRAIRQINFDANYWKSFVAERWRVALGAPGCLYVFGGKEASHRMFADHVTAEYPVTVTNDATQRSVDQWYRKPGAENHLLDSLVLATVGASLQGVSLPGMKPPAPKKQLSFSEQQALARQRRTG